MKGFGILLAALLQGASAFPFVLEEVARRGPVDKRVTSGEPSGIPGCSVNSLCNTKVEVSDAQIGYNPDAPTAAQKASAARNHCGALNPCTVFNAEEQLVSVSGAHAYQSPAANQIRGPCPGLNAAANHGYLARSGVQTLSRTIDGLGAAWGMSPDLAGILAAYAIAIDGDLTSMTWSIGGPQAGVPIIDAGQGISYSHNKYEGDTSIARCDAYVNDGDAHSLSPIRFGYAVYEGLSDDRYDMDKFARAFAKNTHISIQQNSHYFTGLFSTTLVAPAAYNFIIAFMSNHTAEQPDGYLTQDLFKTFFAVEGEYDNYKWLPGQERIPENWYRRPSSQQYHAITGVFGDLFSEYAAYPDTFRFGGNVNGVNTYTGIDIRNFTNGVYNADTLFEGDNFQCFVYQNIQQGLPDVLSANTLTTAATSLLDKYFGPVFGALNCPQLQAYNDNDLPPYPGRHYSPDPPANAPENC